MTSQHDSARPRLYYSSITQFSSGLLLMDIPSTDKNTMLSLLVMSLVIIIILGTYLVIQQAPRRKKTLIDVDRSPLAIFFIEPVSLRFVSINKTAEIIHGYSKKTCQSLSFFDALYQPDTENLRNQMDRCSTQAVPFSERVQFITQDKEVADASISVLPLPVNNRLLLMVTVAESADTISIERKIAQATIQALEEERKALGAELHDNVGQVLATAKLYLGMVSDVSSEAWQLYLEEAKKYLLQSANEIRCISHRISPAFLDYIPLHEAISQLLESINPGNQLKINFDYQNSIGQEQIPSAIKLTIYRILQEQLSNISKYARATELKVDLHICAVRLWMEIADNGVGFDTSSIKHGIGIQNMKRRTELSDGKFSIDAAPQNGCSVSVEIPINDYRAA